MTQHVQLVVFVCTCQVLSRPVPQTRFTKHNVSRRIPRSGDPVLQPRQPSRPPETVAKEAKRRGAQVGGRSRRTWRREQCSREASPQRIEDGKSSLQSSPCLRKDGFLSEVYRTRQKTCDEGRGGHQEGNRAERSVPSGGPGAEQSIEAARVGVSSASTFRHSRRICSVSRCIDSGERFSAGDLVCDFSFAFSVRRILMVRRGWSAIPAPSGWHEIIGPRPPSVQWPKKGKGKGNQTM